MNKERRKEVGKAKSTLGEAHALLEDILEDEQNYLDSMPENMIFGERYSKAEDSCESIQEAIDAIEQATDALDEAIG